MKDFQALSLADTTVTRLLGAVPPSLKAPLPLTMTASSTNGESHG
jgi:hypothetical protein